MESNTYYVLKIELINSEPLIWRRLRIPNDATLHELHECIQILFGWMNNHLYEFRNLRTKQTYAWKLEDAFEDEEDVSDTSGITLAECFVLRESWEYIYDMGDNWRHRIKIEKQENDTETKDEPYPMLVDWAQDNMAEDAGGVEGYYEKTAILADPTHPEHEWIREWMDMQHIDFAEEEVVERLMMVGGNAIDSLLQECVDSFAELFDYMEKEALIRLETHQNLYMIHLLNHDDEQRIEIFRSEEDFAESFWGRNQSDQIPLLYHNGFIIHCFDDEDEDISSSDYNDLRIVSYQAGEGIVEMQYEDYIYLLQAVKYIHSLCYALEDNGWYLPNLYQDDMLKMTENENGYKLLNVHRIPKLKYPRIIIGKKDKESLARVKQGKGTLHINLLTIPNLLFDGPEHEYYIAATGKKSGFLHKLKSRQAQAIFHEIKTFFIDYALKFGFPKEIYVSDLHLYHLFTKVCAKTSVNVNLYPGDEAILAEQFDEAFMIENPIEEMDLELLEQLDQLNGEELERFFMKQSKEQMHRIMKQMAFLRLLDAASEEEE